MKGEQMTGTNDGSPPPALVIISGPPGAGKTSLAVEISRDLGLAMLAKDMFKEAIFDELPGADTSDAHRLGIASVGMMYRFARHQLENGVGIILESTFDRGKAEEDVSPLLELANAVIVHCSAPHELIIERYEERADDPDRHEVHRDEDHLDSLKQNLAAGIYEPMDLDVPTIEVDMTEPDEVDVQDLIIRIRTILEAAGAKG
jgi:predicted kinase